MYALWFTSCVTTSTEPSTFWTTWSTSWPSNWFQKINTRKQTTDSDTAHDRKPTGFASFAKARETYDFGSTDWSIQQVMLCPPVLFKCSLSLHVCIDVLLCFQLSYAVLLFALSVCSVCVQHWYGTVCSWPCSTCSARLAWASQTSNRYRLFTQSR